MLVRRARRDIGRFPKLVAGLPRMPARMWCPPGRSLPERGRPRLVARSPAARVLPFADGVSPNWCSYSAMSSESAPRRSTAGHFAIRGQSVCAETAIRSATGRTRTATPRVNISEGGSEIHITIMTLVALAICVFLLAAYGLPAATPATACDLVASGGRESGWLGSCAASGRDGWDYGGVFFNCTRNARDGILEHASLRRSLAAAG
jgi:hypothetical protein